ncbi:MAG: hypothetical protein H8D34_28825 [Chloroflexi bacterium]|nr:hypothetical protein [Chloroflexota bacterium]
MKAYLDYTDMSKDEFEEIESLSVELGCSHTVAHKILYLEERLAKLEAAQPRVRDLASFVR